MISLSIIFSLYMVYILIIYLICLKVDVPSKNKIFKFFYKLIMYKYDIIQNKSFKYYYISI